MPVYDTPYYGTRRKALTGQSYGPYYGMTFPGGGALPTDEGRRALPPEISDKYQATGAPAIAETAEGITSPALEGSMADDPNAAKTLGYMMFGLGKPPEGVPQMGTLGKAVGYGLSIVGSRYGIPSFATQAAYRGVIHPAAVKIGQTLFPGLFAHGYTAETMATEMGQDIMGALSSAQVSSTSIVGPEGATFGVESGLEGIGLEGIDPGDVGIEGFGGFD